MNFVKSRSYFYFDLLIASVAVICVILLNQQYQMTISSIFMLPSSFSQHAEFIQVTTDNKYGLFVSRPNGQSSIYQHQQSYMTPPSQYTLISASNKLGNQFSSLDTDSINLPPSPGYLNSLNNPFIQNQDFEPFDDTINSIDNNPFFRGGSVYVRHIWMNNIIFTSSVLLNDEIHYLYIVQDNQHKKSKNIPDSVFSKVVLMNSSQDLVWETSLDVEIYRKNGQSTPYINILVLEQMNKVLVLTKVFNRNTSSLDNQVSAHESTLKKENHKKVDEKKTPHSSTKTYNHVVTCLSLDKGILLWQTESISESFQTNNTPTTTNSMYPVHWTEFSRQFTSLLPHNGQLHLLPMSIQGKTVSINVLTKKKQDYTKDKSYQKLLKKYPDLEISIENSPNVVFSMSEHSIDMIHLHSGDRITSLNLPEGDLYVDYWDTSNIGTVSSDLKMITSTDDIRDIISDWEKKNSPQKFTKKNDKEKKSSKIDKLPIVQDCWVKVLLLGETVVDINPCRDGLVSNNDGLSSIFNYINVDSEPIDSLNTHQADIPFDSSKTPSPSTTIPSTHDANSIFESSQFDNRTPKPTVTPSPHSPSHSLAVELIPQSTQLYSRRSLGQQRYDLLVLWNGIISKYRDGQLVWSTNLPDISSSHNSFFDSIFNLQKDISTTIDEKNNVDENDDDAIYLPFIKMVVLNDNNLYFFAIWKHHLYIIDENGDISGFLKIPEIGNIKSFRYGDFGQSDDTTLFSKKNHVLLVGTGGICVVTIQSSLWNRKDVLNMLILLSLSVFAIFIGLYVRSQGIVDENNVGHHLSGNGFSVNETDINNDKGETDNLKSEEMLQDILFNDDLINSKLS